MPDWKPRKGMTYIAARRNDEDRGPVMTVQIDSDPDRLGRCSFTKTWLTNYIPGLPDDGTVRERGQCFFAVPPLPKEVADAATA